MKREEIKEQLIEIETIQIALDDKMHRMEEIQNNLQKRIDLLKQEVIKELVRGSE